MSSRRGSKSWSKFIAPSLALDQHEIERNERRLLPVVRQGWEAAADHHSERIEKREELLLLCLSQIEEAFRHVLGLAPVALDRILHR